jgi:cobyric acid synthase CobQ/L-threonine-O-3-phosphate decarboxylase
MGRHGGNIRELAGRAGVEGEAIIDFSANINSLGPPEYLRAVVSRSLDRVVHYPDPEGLELRTILATKHSEDVEHIVLGNGSTELLFALPRIGRWSRAVIPVPCYVDYITAAEQAGLEVDQVFLRAEDKFILDWDRLESHLQGNEIVFLGQPNNPTGISLYPRAILDAARDNPQSLFVVDEAFLDFVPGLESAFDPAVSNIVVLKSLTKIYAVPGLRLGYGLFPQDLAIAVRETIPPWSVNTMALDVGAAVVKDDDYVYKSRDLVTGLRREMIADLSALPGLDVVSGEANYLLSRITAPDMDALSLFDALLTQGIAIRTCTNYQGLDSSYFRIAIRCQEDNQRLIQALAGVLGRNSKHTQGADHTGKRSKHRVPALMFQGTGSNAGKSILTAALGRILLQDGYRVAPFKAQNMSLNSFVTREGGEMGRAQVVQAQACKLDPDVRMNPVLIKPNSETGSQIIVLGRPVGNMQVMDYVRYKARAWEAVQESYASLAAEHEVMILEGAGSPAEVNLKAHDIVNMHMARQAGAKVLLIGDIDRGGVFASFVGTMEVLAQWERALISGFVINQFRGDASLLDPALEITQRHTGRDVLGVIPHIQHLGLPDEDSVSFKSGWQAAAATDKEGVAIALIDLPHISNFTDFEPFIQEPDVNLQLVRRAADLKEPAAVILPGSKSVVNDLTFLEHSGLGAKIRYLAQENISEIVGVCGGYQMLGRTICDPHGLESSTEKMQGLGLLPMHTVMEEDKTLTLRQGVHCASGLPVHGYEIHHGRSQADGGQPVLRLGHGNDRGLELTNGHALVWGAYLHGLFDADEFRRWFIDRLRQRLGLPPLGTIQVSYDLEPALDRLADIVRENLDVKRLKQELGL